MFKYKIIVWICVCTYFVFWQKLELNVNIKDFWSKKEINNSQGIQIRSGLQEHHSSTYDNLIIFLPNSKIILPEALLINHIAFSGGWFYYLSIVY